MKLDLELLQVRLSDERLRRLRLSDLSGHRDGKGTDIRNSRPLPPPPRPRKLDLSPTDEGPAGDLTYAKAQKRCECASCQALRKVAV